MTYTPRVVTTPLRAAIYCRISLARFGDTLKVDDQERVCRQIADIRGWQIQEKHVYKDNSVSAWRRDRRRPGWDTMLTAIERGEVDAVIVYHGDRLIRQPRDLEDLIDLAGRRGIRLASPTGDRRLDSDDDLFILRIEAAASHREVASTSRRLKRMYDRLADQGVVRLGGRGGRAFGFEPDGRTVRDADAAMLREVADRVLAGEALGAICRDINARGYRTTTGGQWAHGALAKLLRRPRLAGLVSHHGRIIGPAAWPAILDRATWEAVVGVLDRKTAEYTALATNAHRYLLSGIALCGSCGQPVTVRSHARSKDLRGYACINRACPARVYRSVAQLDTYTGAQVVARLGDDRIRQRMLAPDARHLVGRLAGLELRREQVLTEFADDPLLEADVLRVTVRRLDEQIRDLRERVAASQRGHALDGLWGVSRQQWEALALARRRAVVRALVAVRILPTVRRGPGFDPAGVAVSDVSQG